MVNLQKWGLFVVRSGDVATEGQANVELQRIVFQLQIELERERPYPYHIEEIERLATTILAFIESRKDYAVKLLTKGISPLTCLRVMQLLDNIDERMSHSPLLIPASQ